MVRNAYQRTKAIVLPALPADKREQGIGEYPCSLEITALAGPYKQQR